MDNQNPIHTASGVAKVAALVNQYSHTSSLHVMIKQLCEDSEEFQVSFSQCLQHDLALILSRSQDLNDHEISVTQQAFSILMKEPQTHLAGLNLYVDELLGMRVAGRTKGKVMLKEIITMKDTLVHGKRLKSTSSSQMLKRVSPLSSAEVLQHGTIMKAVQVQHSADDDHLAKLWNMYRKARDEYLLATATSLDSRTSAARFLRDTIENAISYLDTGHLVNTAYGVKDLQSMRRELLATLKVATDVTQVGFGGKKRRFDDAEYHHFREPKNMRHETSTTGHSGIVDEVHQSAPSSRRKDGFVDSHNIGHRGLSKNYIRTLRSKPRKHDVYRPGDESHHK